MPTVFMCIKPVVEHRLTVVLLAEQSYKTCAGDKEMESTDVIKISVCVLLKVGITHELFEFLG